MPSLSVMLLEGKQLNRKELAKAHQPEVDAIVSALDGLHAWAAFHSWTFSGWIDAVPHEAHDVLFACFHKALLSLHAARELTLDGLYGLARPHLRHAFESLMIAKYCATDPSSDIYDRWVDGVELYFANGVLKKLAYPDISGFSDLWRVLCQWSHATVFASQVSLDLQTTRKEAALNFALVGAMVHFCDHLLNTHILTRTIKYYARRYGKGDCAIQARADLKRVLVALGRHFGPASRQLVRDYRATWRIK